MYVGTTEYILENTKITYFTLMKVALSGINLTLSMYRSMGSLRPVGFGSDLVASFLKGTQGSSEGLCGTGVGVGTGAGVGRFAGVGFLKTCKKF